jgi:hypothetical protein
MMTVGLSFLMAACSEDFLKPDPLSFFEPAATFTTPQGLQAALTACDRNLRYIWYGEASPLMTDMLFSEVNVEGTTDKSGPAQDINTLVTPTSNNNSTDTNKTKWFWDEGYKGLKYANTVISNIDRVEGLDQEVHDNALGQAYFHRAFRYLFLCFQFGDVPLITGEFTSPRFNLRSTKMQVILEKMVTDMEFAATHVKETVDGGLISRAACKHLLAKLYLATGRFEDAIRVTTEVIDDPKYALMTDDFGTFINPMPAVHPVTRNVIWDLHRPENKAIGANREALYIATSREDYVNSRQDLQTMRAGVPFWAWSGKITTPDGQNGMTDAVNESTNAAGFDLRKTYGRGIGRGRGTWYSTHLIWDDPNDLRHSHTTGNWMRMEDLTYNRIALKNNNNPYFGQKLQKFSGAGTLLCSDTIRSWFDWPHYKLWIASPRSENSNAYSGGAGDWYIYRLAETYLLRAEAYVWRGNSGDAALAMADINAVRTRAKCDPYTDASRINISAVLDERARELYWEELRNVELTRIAYIFCLTGKTAENGKTYSYADFSQDNYWYDRIMKYTEFYNKGVQLPFGGEYTISPYHVFWPVPQAAIDANREDRINQNRGYTGYELNKPPIDNLEEAENAMK